MLRTFQRWCVYWNLRFSDFTNGDQRCSQYVIVICIIAANQFNWEAIAVCHHGRREIYPVILDDPFVFVGKCQADRSRRKPIAIAEIRLPFIKFDRLCPIYVQKIRP